MNRFTIKAIIIVALAAVPAGVLHAQPAPQAAGKSRVVLDRVVAVVQDSIILDSELDTRMQPFLPELETISDLRERNRRRNKLQSQMLEEMIAEELIIQTAKEAKLDVEAKEINAAIEEIKQQNSLDDEGLRKALATQGYTVESYKEDVRRQILRMRAINMMVRPRVTITDDDVRVRYDEMARRSSAVGSVHLKHILLLLPEQPSAEQVAAAKKRAAQIMDRAQAGEAFDALAQEYSDDTATKAGGGDLGWIERGSLPTEWENVVFAMDKGEVRGPIEGPRGLHVFFVEEQKRTDMKSFDELKEQIRNELYRKEMDKQTQLWLEELRKKAHIERKQV